MNDFQDDHFQLLRKLQKKPDSSQRELAKTLGFSLGKLNYTLNSLKNKGLVKIQNFQSQKNKSHYLDSEICTHSKRHGRENKTNYQFHEKKNERVR